MIMFYSRTFTYVDRRIQRKMTLQQRLLAEGESQEETAHHQLTTFMQLAKKTAYERDTLAELVRLYYEDP